MTRGRAGRRVGLGLLGASLSVWPLLAATPARGASTPSAPGTLTVVVPGPFSGCDPGSPTTSASTDAILSLVLPSAFSLTPDGLLGPTEAVPQAEVVQTSPQVVQYSIAPGLTWDGGRAFTAGALVATFDERRADRVLGDLGYRDVASVRIAPGGLSATVTFTSPYADWDSLFDGIVPAATAAAGASCAAPSAALDPSLGPYEIASATTSRVVLRANPAWTGGAVGFGTVDVVDQAAAPAPLGQARVVYLPAPTLGELEAVTSSGSLSSRLDPSTTVVSLDFAVAGPAALPLEARRGVAQLVDRQALLDATAAAVDSNAAPLTSHLFGQGDPDYAGPAGQPVSHPQLPTLPLPGAGGAAAYGTVADVGLAAADLRAAGDSRTAGGWSSDGRVLHECLEVDGTQPSLEQVASDVAAQLTAQGLDVDVLTASGELAVAAALRAGRCAMGILERVGDGFVSHSAASWLALPAPTPTDVVSTGVVDPVVAQDAAAATAILDPVDAAATWDALDARLWNLMVGLPLYSPSAYVGWSSSVAGVSVTSSIYDFLNQLPFLLPRTPRS